MDLLVSLWILSTVSDDTTQTHQAQLTKQKYHYEAAIMQFSLATIIVAFFAASASATPSTGSKFQCEIAIECSVC